MHSIVKAAEMYPPVFPSSFPVVPFKLLEYFGRVPLREDDEDLGGQPVLFVAYVERILAINQTSSQGFTIMLQLHAGLNPPTRFLVRYA